MNRLGTGWRQRLSRGCLGSALLFIILRPSIAQEFPHLPRARLGMPQPDEPSPGSLKSGCRPRRVSPACTTVPTRLATRPEVGEQLPRRSQSTDGVEGVRRRNRCCLRQVRSESERSGVRVSTFRAPRGDPSRFGYQLCREISVALSSPPPSRRRLCGVASERMTVCRPSAASLRNL